MTVHRSFLLSELRWRGRWPSRLRLICVVSKLTSGIAAIGALLIAFGYLYQRAGSHEGVIRMTLVFAVVLLPVVAMVGTQTAIMLVARLFHIISADELRRFQRHVPPHPVSPSLAARIGWWLVLFCLLNWLVFVTMGLYVTAGLVVDERLAGHFYHSSHGRWYEVSETFHQIRRIHGPIWMLSNILALVGAWMAKGCPWPGKRRRAVVR